MSVRRHVGAQPRHRPDEGHRRAAAPRRRPHRPGPRQEVEIVRRMHPPRRREIVRLGRQHRPEPDLRDPRPHDLRPPRQLEGRHDLARHQLDVAGMAGVARRIDRLHRPVSEPDPSVGAATAQARGCRAPPVGRLASVGIDRSPAGTPPGRAGSVAHLARPVGAAAEIEHSSRSALTTGSRTGPPCVVRHPRAGDPADPRPPLSRYPRRRRRPEPPRAPTPAR